MNVYSYIRVSGVSQLDGDGPYRQRDAIQKFSAQHGLEWIGEFFEQGVSGTIDGIERPQFSQMLFCIDTAPKQIHAIVVERMDRLARDLMVSEVLLAELRKRKIQVFATDQGQLIDMASDGGDPTRVLIRQIMGALAQWEKSQLVKKMRAAKDRIKATGVKCEGRKAYGENSAEVHILTFIRNMKGQSMTAQKISDCLNEGGFRTRKGTKFSRQQVEHLLRKEVK